MFAQPSIAVIVPGLGHPHAAHKLQILQHNLGVIRRGFSNMHCFVCVYSDIDLPDIPNVTWFRGPGVLLQNMHRHIRPDLVRYYDMVLVLLDDIELPSSTDWPAVLRAKERAGLDIISPSLASRDMSFWQWMVHDPSLPENAVVQTTRLELFCYLFDKPSFDKYMRFVKPENAWAFGMDFALHSHMHLKVGIFNCWKMQHYYISTTGDVSEKMQQGIDYLQSIGTSWDYLHSLPSVIKTHFV